MTTVGLCTPYASIDASRARAALERAKCDTQRLRQVLNDCFFDGSLAAAEAAACFLMTLTESSTMALDIADMLKSLPTAIPNRNAGPLARVSAFLAISFEEEGCRAVLTTFCYADSFVRRTALTHVVARLKEVSKNNQPALCEGLKRTREFFDGMCRSEGLLDRFSTARGLISVATGKTISVRREVAAFLMELDAASAPFSSLSEVNDLSEDYEFFLVTELANLTKDRELMSVLVLRNLVRSFDCGTMSTLLALWTSHTALVKEALWSIGHDIVLLLTTTSAAQFASHGDLSHCRDGLQLASSVYHEVAASREETDGILAGVIVSHCISIASLSTAAGASNISNAAAALLRRVRTGEPSPRVPALASLKERIRTVCLEARLRDCPAASLYLGLIQKLTELWDKPKTFKEWISQDLTLMLKSAGLSDQLDSASGIIAGGAVTDRRGSQISNMEQVHGHGDRKSETCAVLLGSVTLAALSHENSTVRFTAVTALASLQNSTASLFCLPAVILRLQDETNGAVATDMLRYLVTSKSLLRQSETCSVALNALLRLFSQSSESQNSATLHSGLVALAQTSEYVPGLATPLLLAEIEKMRNSFGLTRGPTRAAAASAVLKLVTARPTRGTNFIPFISLCISPQSMETAPEAASLCFEAMNVMTREEVLDPIKAVKVVLKSFQDVSAVESKARRSYLQLLGSAASGSESKKGKVLAEKVIGILRTCLTLHSESPSASESEGVFPWEHVGEAATSLAQFTTEEILRIGYVRDEVLTEIEAEKERRESIEEDCQSFVKALLSVGAQAYRHRRKSGEAVQALLVKIVQHEWENRKRSSFDPERIAKLRAASDALRRARQARGSGWDNEKHDSTRGSDSFGRAVGGLPTGVVKGVCERCEWRGSGRASVNEVGTLELALQVLSQAGAVSPALPWVSLVDEILRSTNNGSELRASCLAVLREAQDDSFEMQEARGQWFGSQTPLFDGALSMSVLETRELFVGMIRFYPAEATRLLWKHKDTLSSESFLEFVRATRGCTKEETSVAAQGLFAVIGSASSPWDRATHEAVETEFYDLLLQRCDKHLVENMLLSCPSHPAAVRLACLTGAYSLVRHAARLVSTTEADDQLVGTVGRAVNVLDAARRREILLDFCSPAADDERRERRMTVAAYALGVGALLPDAATALSVAVCIASPNERDVVLRTVTSLTR